MLTRKDYVAIAKIVRAAAIRVMVYNVYLDRDYLIAQLADYSAKDNPNFDRARFYKACDPDTT